MTSYTPQHNIPYPDGTDSVVVHTDLKKAVDKIDELIKSIYVRELTSQDDIFTLAPGTYRVASAGYLNTGLPEARFGDLFIQTPNGGRSIWFSTNDLGDVRNGAKLYIIGSSNSGSFTDKKWREVTSVARGLPENHAIDVWAGSTGYNGSFAVRNADVEAVGSHNPSIYGYSLYHETQPNGGSYQTAHATHVGDQGFYHRAETGPANGQLSLWKRLMDERMSPSLNRSELLYQEMAAAYGGKIFTGDAVPVALTFDDYPRDFRDKILPLLTARGLPCTIGLSSKQYDPTSTVIYAGAEGTTWAEIDAWPASVSVANHSATHGPAEDRSSMEKEIVYGLRDLRNALPNKPIYTFMQPSVIYDAGFDNGVNLESYANTIAGHMQLGHHAYVTGTRRTADMATTCVMVGNRPIQGMIRNWLDTATGISQAQSRITGARAKKHGIILGAHADRFGKVDNPTVAEFATFLDWLKAEQDAGRIKVMKLEEFAISQYGSPAPTVSNAVGRTVKVWDHLNNREQLIYGDTGTREITALFPGISAGKVKISREGYRSFLKFEDVVFGASSGTVDTGNLPLGFYNGASASRVVLSTSSTASRLATIYSSGLLRISGVVAGDTFVGGLSIRLSANWPTTLPGVADGIIPNT